MQNTAVMIKGTPGKISRMSYLQLVNNTPMELGLTYNYNYYIKNKKELINVKSKLST